MRLTTVLAVLCLSFLIIGCSWSDVKKSVNDVFSSIATLGDNLTKKTNGVSSPELLECTDEICIRNAVASCTPAKGMLSENGMTMQMMIDSSKEECVLNWTIIAGNGTGTSLWCVFPFAEKPSVERVIDPESGYCEGSWYQSVSSFVNISGPFEIQRVALGKSQVVFNLTPMETVYLKSVVVAGPRISECLLSYKNPVKLVKKNTQPIVLDCKIAGRGMKTSGTIKILYFEKPDFENQFIAEGSFVT